ncbi:MAG: DUF4430 domain-containing protein [Clostridiales bacterium]|nr:DUF4430 domain-containing protein [Clostridiales bacterium]
MKYRNKIIAIISVIVILVIAWFYGGNYVSLGEVQEQLIVDNGQRTVDQPLQLLDDNAQELALGTLDEMMFDNSVISLSLDETSKNPELPVFSEINENETEEITTDFALPRAVSPEKISTETISPETISPETTQMPLAKTEAKMPDGSFSVTLTVRCDMILKNIGLLDKEKWGLAPEDGVIFPTTAVVAYEGESVFNILHRTMKQAKIHLAFRNTPIYNSAYIEAINNLYEFDVGELSGWMYSVNGSYPNYGCSRYQLMTGDVIEWNYSCDLGHDLDKDWQGGRQEDE